MNNRFLLSILLLTKIAIAQDKGPRALVVASGLEHPWGLAFIDADQLLVTERAGRLRLIQRNGTVSAPITGLPAIDVTGQGGLLDIATDIDFARNRLIYFCYAEPAARGNSTALARARLSLDQTRLEQLTVLFSQQPKVSSSAHFGCRIAQAPDSTLFLTLGDRYYRAQDAQTLNNHHGKIIRITREGKVPADNPFVNRAGARPEIWSLGHRNLQGATISPDGRLWTSEHGPQGGDEINHPEAGKNYGWPIITYGENYGGGAIGEGLTKKSGLEQPVHQWTPSIAPAGMTFITTNRYGAANQGSLLVASLKFRYLSRLVLEGTKVVREDKWLTDINQRLRTVAQAPDGTLWLLTDETNGQLLRLTVR